MESNASLFTAVLEPQLILTGPQLESRYSHIWRMDQPLKASCLLLPETTQQVSDILKICNTHNLNVVTHGGLTNLVGSTNSDLEDVVVSLERMNHIIEVNTQSRTATVEAGVILEALQNAVRDKKMFFPLNFGAKGSAQIGGIISTNAGGLRVLKYGMTRNLVLGLEYVLMDGTVISSLKTIIKDNSGYDLKQLIIGSEGTLAIITKTVLKLSELPVSRQAAFVGIKDYSKVTSLLKTMDATFAGRLSGFELIWKNTYQQLSSQGALVRPPLPDLYPYYVLLEMQGSDNIKDRTDLENALEQVLLNGIVEDAVIATTADQVAHFFKIREDVSNLTDFMKHDQHFDISLPIPYIGDYIATCYEQLENIKGVEQIYAFGHVADGNIHFMIGKENDSLALKKEIDHIIYDGLQAINGSVSAEHGIGVDKKDYLHISKSLAEIALMKAIKKTLDPKGLLNQGKIF